MATNQRDGQDEQQQAESNGLANMLLPASADAAR